MHGSKNRWMSHLLLEGCIAAQNTLDGFKIEQTKLGSVSHNLAEGNARHGISIVGGSKHTMVLCNQVEDNKKCGINVGKEKKTRPERALIAENEIVHSGFAGFCIRNADYVIVKDSEIRNEKGTMEYCYDVRDAKTTVVRNITCYVKSERTY